MGDGERLALAYAGIAQAEYLDFRVADGLLRAKMSYDYLWADNAGYDDSDTGFTQVFRWNGEAFDRVAGRADHLNFRGENDAIGSPVQLAAILRDGVEVCPAARVSFGSMGTKVGDFEYEPASGVLPYDLDGDGDDELIAGIRCFGPGILATSVYVFGQGETEFVTLAVPFANDGRYYLQRLDIRGTTIVLKIMQVETAINSTSTMAWDGERFVWAGPAGPGEFSPNGGGGINTSSHGTGPR